jgi:hypothetical protein
MISFLKRILVFTAVLWIGHNFMLVPIMSDHGYRFAPLDPGQCFIVSMILAFGSMFFDD